MTLQINHSAVVCDETYRKLVVNTLPDDEVFHTKELEFGKMTC